MQPAAPLSIARPRRTWPRVALTGAAVVASLVAAEGIARVAASLEPDALAGIYRASTVPGVGYTLAPNLDTRALGADLRTNHLGFRGPQWTARRKPGAVRIALIGDSHAFGFGVHFTASLGEVLARELSASLGRPVEVLNFAVNGYNSVQELAVLRGFALGYAPDVVILVPSNNDDEPSCFASRAGYLIARPEDADLPPPAPPPAPRSALLVLAQRAVERAQRQLARGGGTAHAAPATDSESLVANAAVPDRLVTVVADPLHEMVRLSRARGAQVVLAPFAGPYEWRRMLRDLARDEDLPLVELLPLLHEARDWQEVLDRFGLGWNPHLGPVAHARWGQALARVLRERVVLPSS